MQLNAIQVIGLLILVLIIPAYQTMRSWRQHRLRQQMADAHDWRYTIPGWQAVLKPEFSISGTTTRGMVWVLKREMHDKQWFFVWRCRGAPLPYGRLHISPRHKPVSMERNRRQNLRPVRIGSADWLDKYVLLTTHDVLANRYVSREVELALLDWPIWPAPGSLERIDWSRDELSVRVRYQSDLYTLDKIVILGTALVENVPQVKDVPVDAQQ